MSNWSLRWHHFGDISMVLNGAAANTRNECKAVNISSARAKALEKLECEKADPHPAVLLARQTTLEYPHRRPGYTWSPWPSGLEVRVRTFPSELEVEGGQKVKVKPYDFILGPTRLVLQYPFSAVSFPGGCFDIQALKTEGADLDYDPGTDVLADPMLDAADDLVYRERNDVRGLSRPDDPYPKSKLENWAQNHAAAKRANFRLPSGTQVHAVPGMVPAQTRIEASGGQIHLYLGTSAVPVKEGGSGEKLVPEEITGVQLDDEAVFQDWPCGAFGP